MEAKTILAALSRAANDLRNAVESAGLVDKERALDLARRLEAYVRDATGAHSPEELAKVSNLFNRHD
ncbi:MAG: hypothetical protein HXY22_09700 [Alphaproteobacteria bacterium]|nr:hypothetical protein [Alphaproteobacteria bacterium]